MPKGQRELFKVNLVLDRRQRKTLDSIIEKCSLGINSLVRESIFLTNETKTPINITTFESWVNDPQICDQSLNDGTRKEMARIACEKYVKVIAGEIIARGKRTHAMVCRLTPEDVIFSVTERVVRLPHFGICKFTYNNKVMLKIQDMLITKNGDHYSIGYWNNRPTLVITIKEKKTIPIEDFSNQKLVKIKVSKTDHRMRAPEKDHLNKTERK